MTKEIEIKLKLKLGMDLVRDLEIFAAKRGMLIEDLIIEILKEAVEKSD